ncbi:MAG: ATP-dependent DNA helicase [Candidatus Desulforudaceae bacterium]
MAVELNIDSLIKRLESRGPTTVEKAFRQALPTKVPSYEVREQQIEMARTVERALAEKRHLIAEAGTGTGKSFGYMVPAIYHVKENGGRVVVSTGTIALQEQLINKDIPFLQRTLGIDFKAKLAKGKNNYLCLLRFNELFQQLAFDADNEDLALVANWAENTETGDKSEMPMEPGAIWSKICVDDDCTGHKCRYVGSCFYKKARAGLDNADIIITNHHLFFLDLALRGQTDDEVSILPDYSAVILDEAHHAENIARNALSTQASSMRLPMLLSELRKRPGASWDAIEAAREANDAFFTTIAANPKDRFVFRPDEDLKKFGHDLQDAVKDVGNSFDTSEAGDREFKLLERLNRYRVELGFILSGFRPDVCYWTEVYRGPRPRVTLHATPIDVAPALREMLFNQVDTVVLTSATLSTAGSFSYLKQSIGLDECLELQADSPFDFYSQCLLYLPPSLPDPKAADFHERVTPMIEELLLKVDGRAFVLFTSYKGLNEVYDRLSGRLKWNILKQGDKSKQAILEEFRATNSVLFATSSFWEGIDIQGEALSCVVLVKLPFAVPDDPITEAKVKAIEAAGGKAFFDYSLPEAILKLKQGFGRLIRTRSDRGIVAILDPRVKSKGYGRRFLMSLPRCREISSSENVDLFLKGGN